ncbi:LuxR C-terminal-related transcriptional regulator [Agrococcus sp. ARC_14]|uniref:helix-turn-helix transcriptional regulator n=1 Tax=Agrococcus sp. ARC_14 TaxID=2919927 RepID=UPI001F05820B|nr:LuxR C-terminal-related transcriptional regulator [Agrococcus sp. ARC_14]MCH1882541.1 LuxR C-terminal-related transcriptional regulator [Agrococcus sp. ARC_14]
MSIGPKAAAVIDLAHDLEALSGAAEYDAQAARLLGGVLPADEIIWARVDFIAGTAIVRGATPEVNGVRAAGLARFGHTHQGVRSYEQSPTDRSPRRMSDVASQEQWHATALYQEVYRELGRAHQLGLMTRMAALGIGEGWTFTRTGSDFTDRELEVAQRVLPVLIALEARRPVVQAQPSATVKPRELVLLTHLAEGHTARSIGHRMGITERTVRKHLGDLYVVLRCNDRLVAVQRAKDLGLLPR